MEDILFIYFKKSKIKALCHSDAKIMADKLLKNGWIHTSTIKTSQFLTNLYNNHLGTDKVNLELINLTNK